MITYAGDETKSSWHLKKIHGSMNPEGSVEICSDMGFLLFYFLRALLHGDLGCS